MLDNYRNLGKEVIDLDRGKRIDRFLGEKFLFHSRNEWSKRLKRGEVFVNAKVVKSSYKLHLNDRISYFCPPSWEPEVDRGIKVIWEENGVLAIYKPSNLPMHEGGRYRKNTFSVVLREKIGEEWSAVHRLDRDTSGIVLCAKNQKLRNSLSAELRERTMQKTYFAIVHGHMSKQTIQVNKPLGETPNSLFRIKNWVIPNGLPSITNFEVLDVKDKYSLLKVSPLTGRTHQIRIHASYIGHHLIGDKKYHPDETVFLEYLDYGFTDNVKRAVKFDRLCLHAGQLSFKHPISGKRCIVSSEIPDDMKTIWKKL